MHGLLEDDAGEGKRETELAIGELDELAHESVGREVATLGNLAEHLRVEQVIFVESVLPDFEKIVGDETVGLMRMKCEGDIHGGFACAFELPAQDVVIDANHLVRGCVPV